MIPEFAREALSDNAMWFRQPLPEIAAMIASAERGDGDAVKFGIEGGSELTAVINHEVAQADRARYGGLDLPPTQHVERIYRSVSVTVLRRILDVVRTTLVELVAEMRAGRPRGESVPAPEVGSKLFRLRCTAGETVC